jgi:hypothetical protein
MSCAAQLVEFERSATAWTGNATRVVEYGEDELAVLADEPLRANVPDNGIELVGKRRGSNDSSRTAGLDDPSHAALRGVDDRGTAGHTGRLLHARKRSATSPTTNATSATRSSRSAHTPASRPRTYGAALRSESTPR